MGGDVVVRHFDAPEALGTRFHEVRTKSALNRVPTGARVPFEWTVNPYRGCAHACVYCAAGDTRILMADGSQRALADLREGDEIVGTERGPRYRRYVETKVLAHWSSIKAAYRVTLADGTELVASGDHRFLTRRGWKHVTGAEQGAGRRPHLTLASQLIGTGRFADPPDAGDPEYRRGYLSALIRGDGALAAERRFRLALTDAEALDRAREFLLAAGVEADRHAIRTRAPGAVAAIEALIAWPAAPSERWAKGFLAGIFDADGSCDGHALRMANADPALVACTSACLTRFGFDVAREPSGHDNGLVTLRVRGGLRERLRLFHLSAPAVSRRLRLVGAAVKHGADLQVTAIEPVGTMRLYDITTGTSDFIANGVVSHNCFARPTHEYLELDAGRDFEREIVVKVNVPEVLRAELAKPSWGGHHVALGTNTDPYQWVEGRYKLMRGVWEAMRDFANPCSILTKSPLVLRDADLLRQIGERTHVSACLSVPTLDERAWRSTEPKTPHPKARLEAVAELNRIGIPTGVLIAPLMPGVNDDPAQVERIVELATEAGAVHIGGNTLFLRGAVRDIFFEWLEAHRPDLLERYRKLYARGAYVPADERRTIEVAAGAPWARRRYADRFRHRTSRSADYDPRENGEFGTLRLTPPAGDRGRAAARGGRRDGEARPAAGKEVAAPAQGALF